MKKAIKHLIQEYNNKINDRDVLLNNCSRTRRDLRHKGHTKGCEYESISKEMAVLNAQKQAYVQAKADIDSLFDFID